MILAKERLQAKEIVDSHQLTAQPIASVPTSGEPSGHHVLLMVLANPEVHRVQHCQARDTCKSRQPCDLVEHKL